MERETTNDSAQHPEGEADVDMELGLRGHHNHSAPALTAAKPKGQH